VESAAASAFCEQRQREMSHVMCRNKQSFVNTHNCTVGIVYRIFMIISFFSVFPSFSFLVLTSFLFQFFRENTTNTITSWIFTKKQASSGQLAKNLHA